MDRRSILFVIGLSLTLLGVSQFFNYQNEQKRQEWAAQQNQKKIAQENRLNEEIALRTASVQQLPVIRFYADPEKTTVLNSGVEIDGNLLTLSWQDKEAPSKVFAENKEGQLETYEIVYQKKESGQPLLYRSTKSQLPLKAAVVPDFGQYDVQLVNFSNQMSPKVTLGEYIDGQFMLHERDLKNESESRGAGEYTAIALFKTPQGFLPVGLYDNHEHRLVRLPEIEGLNDLAEVVREKKEPGQPQKMTELFYVLENEYMQLVFSNYGAALAEINLPFRTEQNEKSVVREIAFDRDMVTNHPYNAYFPANPYFTPQGDSVQEHSQGTLGGYYPLIRRDLIETGKRQSVDISPQYYAMNIVSEYPELSQLVYEVKHFDKDSITFEAIQNHRRITKTFSFNQQEKGAPYCLNLDVNIQGDSRGLWLTSGIPEVEWISGGPAPTLKYRLTRNQKSEVNAIELPKDAATVTSVYPDWICNSNGFLGMIIDPLTEIDPGYRVQHIPGTVAPSRLVEVDQEYDRYKAENLPGYMTLLPLKSKGGLMQFRLFAGPFDSELLKEVDAIYTDPASNYNPDYVACQTMHGWFTFISEPFAKFLWILMRFFHSLTDSWALSIILLTASLRLMLYPLNNWSTKSMVRMQQIGPEVTAIQEKHKKDPQKAQLEVMNLYKERGINPASGCLPLLIQMPFLIGMFDLLKSSFALRGAPFIPGWIDDLTAPDVLFSWNYPIFFIGNQFHLLPILLAFVMFIQQRFFSTAPKDPNQMTDQQRQQRVMGNMMTVVFAFMFYNFPSGLNIYWLSSMLLGMLQQWYITKQVEKTPVIIKAKAPAKR